MNKFTVRQMRKDELCIAIDWAAKEGWNPGLKDDECFYAADPNGFFIGLLGDEPVATISSVSYDQDFGFMGLYIVKPEYRNQGYGMAVWNKALDYLGLRNAGGDGVLERIEDYKTQGFKPAYRNIRFQGLSWGKKETKRALTEISQIPLDSLFNYDDELFFAQRHNFLKCWISQSGHYGLGYLEKNLVRGYGVIRKSFSGYKIGPLFADNHSIATDILYGLISSLPEKTDFFLDVPEPNVLALSLANSHGMKGAFETIRIYTKEAPAVPLEKWYGVTSFELG
ncbi:MAG: GNAT family N-acetyltransferase [Candidatus Omnitrophota bacterium]